MKKTNLITAKRLVEIQEEFRYLVDVRRPQIIAEIQSARDQGDLSENADYESSKEAQSQLESRINELKTIIDNHEIIDEEHHGGTNKMVTIGSVVTYKNLLTNQTCEFEIVGSLDANPKNNKISNESPVAKALLGRQVNEVVLVKGIAKQAKLKILSIN